MANFDLSMAITANGSQAAGEVRNVQGAVKDLGSAQAASVASTDAATAATKRKTQADLAADKAARQHATATRMLGVQFNDLGTQIAAGSNPATALTMQLGQMGYAMSEMGGRMGRVGAILAGPWGAAITLAIAGLGILYTKLTDAGDAAKKAGENTDIQKMSLEELKKALDDSNRSLEQSNRTTRQAQKAALDDAIARAQRVIRIREEAVAILELTKAQYAQARSQTFGAAGGAGAGMAQGVYAGRIDEAEKLLREARAAQVAARANLQAALTPIFRRQSEERTDPSLAPKKRFEEEEERILARYREGAIGLAELNRQLDANNRLRQTETKTLQQSNRTPRTRAAVEKPVTLGEVTQILREMGATVGSTIRSPERNKAVGGARNSHHLTGQAVDFIPKGGLGNFSREQIREAFRARGINLLELLGPGDRGHDDHGHLAFARNRLGGDEIIRQGVQEREQAARRAEQLAEFGGRAGDALSGFSARFGGGPRAVVAAQEALEDLARLMSEIEEKKPPNMAELLAQAREAGDVIRESIQRPFEDFVEEQRFAMEQGRLIAAGREDEAEAVRIIRDLQREMGTLLPEQAAAVRVITAARKAEQREAEVARQKQQKYLDAVDETREAIRDIFTSGGEGLRDLPKRLGNMVQKLVGDWLFESLLGDAFRDLEAMAKGETVLQDAAGRMAASVDKARDAVAALANSAQAAADKLAGVATGTTPAPGDGDLGEVVVTGARSGLGSRAIRDPGAFFGEVIKKLAEGILGKEMAERIGKIVGAAIKNAAIGNTAAEAILGPRSKTGKLLSSLGGAIGGFGGKALGSAIGGPIGGAVGEALGSALGGLVGGLIGGKPKPQYGTARVTSSSVDSSGRGDGLARNASGLGNSVQEGISSIAEQLGARIGDYNVSIGTYKDKYRVSTNGYSGGPLNFKGQSAVGLKDFGDDQAGAIAFAIADAIADGAILGISDAVRKALGSSTDVNKALAEALKVQDLELRLAGLGGELEKTFRAVEKEAQDRLRIARTYGLDIVKTEELNAKARADALRDAVEQRTGALRDLLSNMLYGDLFEGTPNEQRQRILAEVTQQRGRAEAGEAGAGDRLADLLRQLTETTREAYGTAGPELAADREMARADAERIIALETQRAKEAQERAIASLQSAQATATNTAQSVALQNETNNLLARMVAAMSGGGGGAIRIDSGYSLSRQVAL